MCDNMKVKFSQKVCLPKRWAAELVENTRAIVWKLDTVLVFLREIVVNTRRIMALVSVEQSVLDAIGTELSGVADAVQAIVDDQSNPLEAADLTGITQPLSRVQELLTKPQEPVEPTQPPADEDDEVSDDE